MCLETRAVAGDDPGHDVAVRPAAREDRVAGRQRRVCDVLDRVHLAVRRSDLMGQGHRLGRGLRELDRVVGDAVVRDRHDLRRHGVAPVVDAAAVAVRVDAASVDPGIEVGLLERQVLLDVPDHRHRRDLHAHQVFLGHLVDEADPIQPGDPGDLREVDRHLIGEPVQTPGGHLVRAGDRLQLLAGLAGLGSGEEAHPQPQILGGGAGLLDHRAPAEERGDAEGRMPGDGALQPVLGRQRGLLALGHLHQERTALHHSVHPDPHPLQLGFDVVEAATGRESRRLHLDGVEPGRQVTPPAVSLQGAGRRVHQAGQPALQIAHPAGIHETKRRLDRAPPFLGRRVPPGFHIEKRRAPGGPLEPDRIPMPAGELDIADLVGQFLVVHPHGATGPGRQAERRQTPAHHQKRRQNAQNRSLRRL